MIPANATAARYKQIRCRRWHRLVPALGLVLAAAAQSQVHELGPGLLVDVGQSTAYVMRPGGGVAALSLASGEARWQSDRMDRPVSLAHNRLLGQVDGSQSGSLTLVTLDGASGAWMASTTTELEPEVWATVDQGLGTHFELQALRPGSGDQLQWRYQRRTVKGAQIGPNSDHQKSQGLLRMDPATGTLVPEPADALQWTRPAAAREVVELDGVAGRQFLAQDGAHVLASQRRAGGDPAQRYLWQIYDRNGNQQGRFISMVSFTPFLVTEGLVLMVNPPHAVRGDERMVATPLSLVAVDLASGEVRWTAAIRDTRYRGPLPS